MRTQKWSLRLLAVALVVLAGASVAFVPAAAATTSTDWCTDLCWEGYAWCAYDCPETGPNKAYCFRICRAEYNECLASC